MATPHSKHLKTSQNSMEQAMEQALQNTPFFSFDLSLRRPTRNQWDKVANLGSSWYQQQSPEDNLISLSM